MQTAEELKREWADIEEFPNYQVSNRAEFVNLRTQNSVIPSRNQMGHAKITLVKDRVPTTRSVAVIVANAFLGPPNPPHFDTPIHLDGQLMNCAADNLMWRPRWFAIRYHKQFRVERFYEYDVHIEDIETGEVYDSVKDVCITHGLHYMDVIRSYVEETYVPLTLQEFRRVR